MFPPKVKGLLGKDWHFLYNHYILRIREYPGEPYKWSFSGPATGGSDHHNEEFLEPFILRKGTEFLDVGANVGAWTVRASPYYEQVIGFEPNPRFVKEHERNLRLNHARNVRVYPVALSDEQEEGLTVQKTMPPRGIGNPWRATTVPSRTLDSFKLSPSVLKVDVEGAAGQVIRGGLKTISQSKPTVIVEVHNQEESEVPNLLGGYAWKRFYRNVPELGDWLWRENGKQLFLVGE